MKPVARSALFNGILLADKFAGSILWMYDYKTSTGTRKPDNTALHEPKVNTSREAMAAFMQRASKA